MKLRTVAFELACLTVIVGVLWILSYVFGRNNMYSAFFDHESYFKDVLKQHEKQRISALRAFEDLKQLVSEEKLQTPLFDKGTNLCVAILSMNRQGNFQQSYLTRLVMSLVKRMDWKREDISISILNMEPNPAEHMEANELGKYFRVKVPHRDTSDISPPEEKHGRSHDLWNETIDYMAALETVKQCRYALVLEDDALAAMNWDQKIDAVIKELDRKEKVFCVKPYFPYPSLGWESGWRDFATLGALAVLTALLASLIFGTVLYGTRTKPKNSSKMFENQLERRTLGLSMLSPVCTILLFLNFFEYYHALGRQHVLSPAKGLQERLLGYSLTAALYPQSIISGLIEFYRSYLKKTPHYRIATKDVIPYFFLKQAGLKEYVTNPSIFQHCGVHSSLNYKTLLIELRHFIRAINFEYDERDIKLE